MDYDTLLAEIRSEHHRLEQRLVNAWQEALEEISIMLDRPADLRLQKDFDQMGAVHAFSHMERPSREQVSFADVEYQEYEEPIAASTPTGYNTDTRADQGPYSSGTSSGTFASGRGLQKTDKIVTSKTVDTTMTADSTISHGESAGIFGDLPLQVPKSAGDFEKIVDTYFPQTLQTLQKTKETHKKTARFLAKVHLSFARKVVESYVAEIIIALAIVSNALFAAIDSNAKLQLSLSKYDSRIGGYPEDKSGTYLDKFEVGFCIFFTLELLVRVAAYGPITYIGDDWRWNLFDSVLVVFSILSICVDFGNNLSYGRLFRLLRMAKAIRIVRVLRYFEKTRLMLYSVLNSLAPLLYSFAFVMLILYLCAIWMMAASVDFIEMQGAMSERVVASSTDRCGSHMNTIKTFFSSFFMTMLSLFMTISGGKDWWDLVEFTISGEVSLIWGLGFIFFECLMVLGVLNIITGLFVTAAEDLSQIDKQTAIAAEQRRAIVKIRQLKSLFNDFDTDGSGDITWSEFERHMNTEEIKSYFAALEISVGNARALFKLLDVEGKQTISVDDFVLGCLRLKGNAKTLDVGALMYECRNLKRRVCNDGRFTKKHLKELNDMMSAQTQLIRATLGSIPTRSVSPSPRNRSAIHGGGMGIGLTL